MKREKVLSVRCPRLAQLRMLKLCIAAFVLAAILAATGVRAQTITAIYDFGSGGSTDPLNPQGVGVISQGRDGNMWSTTPAGGLYEIGAAFKITPAGKMTKVHDFNPNAKPVPEGMPYSGLSLGTDGNFYGTMYNGGASDNGAVFKMTPAGKVTILYSFIGGNDGKNPYAPPIEGADGNFYGTTYIGGLDNDGTVYWMTPSGKLTTCVSFNGSDGYQPVSLLVQATNGNFYGTTSNANGAFGAMFQVTPANACVVTTQYIFSNSGGDGAYPSGALIQGTDGDLYSTTYDGGVNNNSEGVVYKINPAGQQYAPIYLFNVGAAGDGLHPQGGLLLATDGNFYGVTSSGGADGFGTLYQLSPNGKKIQPWPFTGQNGANPTVTPVQNTNGTIYGDATIGGATTNTGTFWKFTGLKFEKTPFVSLLPASGKVGSTVEILGQGFVKGSTTVSFNGGHENPGTVVSATYMTAKVPEGATTGFVTVTTPKETLKSNKKFRVTK
jgi:uncharacterized repeat protein (TIGR03803 family)